MAARCQFLAALCFLCLYLVWKEYISLKPPTFEDPLSEKMIVEVGAGVDIISTTTTDREVTIEKEIEANDQSVEVYGTGTDDPFQGKHCLVKRPKGPTPVILMTQGRSGSHSTWQILGTLTGRVSEPHEYTGMNEAQSKIFFESLSGDEQAPNWIVNRMCHKQWNVLHKRKKPGAENGIVGFNWKPYAVDMKRPVVQQGLSVIAELSKTGAPQENVRIVRSTRNAFDLYLARLKHEQAHLRAHCYTENCVNDHLLASRNLQLNVSEVIEAVQSIIAQENFVDEQLKELEVSVVHTSYDLLYFPETPESGSGEWNKVLQFLGKRANYTWDEIYAAMPMIPTTASRSHRDRIVNFEEIEMAFREAGLEFLLRT